MPCASPAPGRSPLMRSRRPKRVRHSSQALNGTHEQSEDRHPRHVAGETPGDAGDVGDEEPILLLEPTEQVGRFPAEQVTARKEGEREPSDRRNSGRLRDRPTRILELLREDLRREEPGSTRTEDVDRNAGDDVIDTELHRGDGMQEAAQGAAECTQHEPPPRTELSAPQAPNHVPSTIMPSSPMLTTPARSANRPPSPASRIGTPHRNMARVVPSPSTDWCRRSPARCSTRRRPRLRTAPNAAHAGRFFR